MAKQSTQLQALADHELEAAERMKWWGVFLIHENRRLQGIAAAVLGGDRNERPEINGWADASSLLEGEVPNPATFTSENASE